MVPNFRLAMIFMKLAKNHGNKVLHAGNPDLLTRDLAAALKKQKDIISDPDLGNLMTAYEVLPVVLEVKILQQVVAKQLNIETRGKAPIAVLEDIIAKTEASGSTSAQGIKETLEWTRGLFNQPEIRDILLKKSTEIKKPESVKDVGRLFAQIAFRTNDEFQRVTQFLARIKKDRDDKNNPPPAPPSAPKT